MKLALIVAAVVASLAAASGWTAYAMRPPVVHTHTVTRTVTVTRTAPPVVHWRTRVKRVTVAAPPSTSPAYAACIQNLWDSYVSLAQGGPAGDPSVFQADCPGVHINGLTTP